MSAAQLHADPESSKMSTLSERILISERPGYWAVQVRIDPAAGLGGRYLCHAPNDPAASAIAGGLMGSAMTVRGYDLSWIDEVVLEREGGSLPALGGHRTVYDPNEWAKLLAAHALSGSSGQQEAS